MTPEMLGSPMSPLAINEVTLFPRHSGFIRAPYRNRGNKVLFGAGLLRVEAINPTALQFNWAFK